MGIFQNYVSLWANFVYDRDSFFIWFYFEEYIQISESISFKCSHSYAFPLNALAMALIFKSVKIFDISYWYYEVIYRVMYWSMVLYWRFYA